MSRSCQSGIPSVTGVTYDRTIRARPAIRSDMIGFFLCGIALEPFWPARNGSASSRTSVRWPCRTSSPTASQTVAMIASADTHSAIPSRSTTWLATSAGRRPSAGRPTPPAPGPPTSTSRPRRRSSPPRPPPGPGAAGPGTGPARRRSRPAGARTRPARRGCRGSGRPAACPGAPGRAPAAPRPARPPWPAARRVASTSCTASAVSSRSEEVSPKWTYAAAARGRGVVRPGGAGRRSRRAG